jgi:type III pantothenate kinase
MLLAIDIGNTNTVFALCEGESIAAHWRIRTDHHRTGDEYAVWLLTLMQRGGFEATSVTQVAIASVVPDAVFHLKSLSRSVFAREPLIIGSGAVAIDMKVKIDNPHELGADRLVNAYAAWKKYHEELIIVDFGTATTFDVVSAQGEYCGGVIAPGVNLSLEALQRAAARLHGIAITQPAQVVGTNTTAAMQSGIYFGYLAMVDGICARIQEERNVKARVIATGGLAPLYASASDAISTVDADLTIHGIRLISKHLAR